LRRIDRALARELDDELKEIAEDVAAEARRIAAAKGLRRSGRHIDRIRATARLRHAGGRGAKRAGRA
jgi:hypothetical protein